MRKAFICPSKYVQGEEELLNLGYFVKTFGQSALLIGHESDVKRVKEALDHTADTYKIKFVESNFRGECSRQEILRLETLALAQKCDCIIGLGGGKAIDTAKCVAKGENLIIVPTIAATDAPTSHSAVIYTEEGAFEDYAYFKQNPSVVLVDTSVIAKAPARFLVSGMGDALSTYFEARATQRSYGYVNAGLPCGAMEDDQLRTQGSLSAQVLGELCYKTLLADGKKAVLACQGGYVTQALENIIEANILLSGLGFESGGLAAAHAIHNGLTLLEESHDYFHGEKVAFGTLVQLVLENAPKVEIDEVLDFCYDVGLPICLDDLGVKSLDEKRLSEVSKKACLKEESIHNMPFEITESSVAGAILTADLLGQAYKKSKGVSS